MKGNVPGSLGDISLDELAKVEQIFAKKAQSYKSMSKVVEQPPRVTEEATTPPRVETPTAPDMIRQAPIGVGPIQSHPNEDDDEDEIMERPRFSTQEDEAYMPARNTRAQRITPTQEVIYSCMKITSTPATPRNLASRKFLMKLLCEIAGAALDGSTGEILEYRHLRINLQYRQV